MNRRLLAEFSGVNPKYFLRADDASSISLPDRGSRGCLVEVEKNRWSCTGKAINGRTGKWDDRWTPSPVAPFGADCADERRERVVGNFTLAL
jgi:hypothetical protein